MSAPTSSNELNDYTVAAIAAGDQIIFSDASDANQIKRDSSGNIGTVISLDDLSDVTITGQATGDIVYAGSASSWVNLAAGTNGQVLTLAAGVPSWSTGGDMILAAVQTVTGAKTFGTIGGAVDKFILAGSTSGSTIVNAAAVAGSTTMTFPGTSGTVVITGLASQITIGSEVTGASTALTDTLNIAYLNTANDWTTGLQNFSAVALRIPASATPSVTVDGDIAYDDTVADFSTGLIKFFGVEEQGIVSMPIAQFTTPSDGNVVSYNATNDEFELTAAEAAFDFIIDGGGSVITTGIKGVIRIPFDCEIVLSTLLADVSGSIVVDINRYTSLANYNAGTKASITSATPPTLSSEKSSEDSTLTSWTVVLNQGDILEWEVDSVTTVTKVTSAIRVTKRG